MKPLNLTEVIRARRLKRQSLSNAFNDEFAVEILKSDKLRISILLSVWVSVCVVVVSMVLTFSQDFQKTFHGRFDGFFLSFLIAVGVTTFYLVIERVAVNRLIRTGKHGVIGLRYLSAFIETSIPSLGMY